VVLGNEMAIRAIAAGHTNPWPDGSIPAKVGSTPSSAGVLS
jgi:hypothetical protein